MKRVNVLAVCLLIVATFFIFGKISAGKNANDMQEPVKASEATGSTDATEVTEPAESTEATIPYSDPYNSPDTGADPAEVDEDAE